MRGAVGELEKGKWETVPTVEDRAVRRQKVDLREGLLSSDAWDQSGIFLLENVTGVHECLEGLGDSTFFAITELSKTSLKYWVVVQSGGRRCLS